MLTRHILPAIGAMKAGEVSKRDLNRLLDAVVAKPDARTTKAKRPQRQMTIRPNRVFELVRAIFRWTVGRGELRIDSDHRHVAADQSGEAARAGGFHR